MPKDERKIISAVRVPANAERGTPRQVFKAGDEEELAKALDSKSLAALEESGAISGFAAVKKAEEPKGGKK